MTEQQCRRSIRILVGLHALVGSTMMAATVLWPRLEHVGGAVVFYAGFVCSEVLLVGMWLGLSSARWPLRLAGLLVGASWLECLCVAPLSFRDAALEAVPLFGIPVMAVALSCLACRRWLAKIQWRSDWQSRPLSEELQFTLRSLIALTVTTGGFLALGRFSREVGPAEHT